MFFQTLLFLLLGRSVKDDFYFPHPPPHPEEELEEDEDEEPWDEEDHGLDDPLEDPTEAGKVVHGLEIGLWDPQEPAQLFKIHIIVTMLVWN